MSTEYVFVMEADSVDAEFYARLQRPRNPYLIIETHDEKTGSCMHFTFKIASTTLSSDEQGNLKYTLNIQPYKHDQ